MLQVQLENELKEHEKNIQESTDAFDWFNAASKRQEDKVEVYRITQELNALNKQEKRVALLKERRKVIKVIIF